MAVLVLRGADTKCQPVCSEGQQLEPSTEYLFRIFARWVEDYVGGLNSCLYPTQTDVAFGPTNTRRGRRSNLRSIIRLPMRPEIQYNYYRLLAVKYCQCINQKYGGIPWELRGILSEHD